MNLIVNRYLDSTLARQEELDEALRRNLEHPLITTVHLIGEFENDPFADHAKVRTIPCAGRPSFATYFACVRPAMVNIIANSDICFDETLEKAYNMGWTTAYALSRWDDETIQNQDSQDVWIIRYARPGMNLEFGPGVCGCDNRLAWELKNVGYRVQNPAKSIRAIHLHKSNIRHYVSDPATSIPKPYLLIEPHAFGDAPKYRELLPQPELQPQ